MRGPSVEIESVWDYPRPPRIEPVSERIRIVVSGVTIADSTRAFRVVETSHPPSYYLPPDDVRLDLLVNGRGASVCEWKGSASYRTLVLDDRLVEDVAWMYAEPAPGFEALTDHLAFYPAKVDEAWVGDELAAPQAGGFYGGWITSRVRGPFKGDRSTLDW